ncbi:MAG TPA: hypothetical protein ENK18_28185 [Deltaproteobacteria bacterium]|nr:hypothetical protein [Deltaproteobacteria bacterium]
MEQTGENEFSLSRATLDKTIGSLNGLSRMGSVIPYMEDGAFSGFKLSMVRRSGIAGKLGLQSGDILTTVNGSELDSPEAATEAFSSIKGADRFCFGITRGGSPTELCYEVE